MLDLGCGTGEALERVTAAAGAGGIGIDISVDAIDRAARRAPALTWVVANADRRLPLLDASVGLVLSFNARRNPAECARVLAPGSRLLVAVPAPDDLIELRALVQGEGAARERADAVVEEHAPFFALGARDRLAERHTLDGPGAAGPARGNLPRRAPQPAGPRRAGRPRRDAGCGRAHVHAAVTAGRGAGPSPRQLPAKQ